MHCSYFVRPGSEGRDRDAQTRNLSCQKLTTLPATRGAGLIQIANLFIESCISFLGNFIYHFCEQNLITSMGPHLSFPGFYQHSAEQPTFCSSEVTMEIPLACAIVK
jgi:hypothetical protein